MRDVKLHSVSCLYPVLCCPGQFCPPATLVYASMWGWLCISGAFTQCFVPSLPHGFTSLLVYTNIRQVHVLTPTDKCAQKSIDSIKVRMTGTRIVLWVLSFGSEAGSKAGWPPAPEALCCLSLCCILLWCCATLLHQRDAGLILGGFSTSSPACWL